MSIQEAHLPGDMVEISVDGRLDHHQAPYLEELLSAHLDAGHRLYLIDLSGVSFINSGGLRTLVTAWRRAREQEGNLVLFGLGPRIVNVFSMVGFDKVFTIVPDREAALAALRA